MNGEIDVPLDGSRSLSIDFARRDVDRLVQPPADARGMRQIGDIS